MIKIKTKIMTKIKGIYQRMARALKYHSNPGLYYVIADATDNTFTLSEELFEHMGVMELDVAKAFVFSVGQGHYAFMLNPELGQPSQLADVQYNSKYRSIGFQSLCPSVNRIFYDYRLPHGSRARLSVKPCSLRRRENKIRYYKILRPR